MLLPIKGNQTDTKTGQRHSARADTHIMFYTHSLCFFFLCVFHDRLSQYPHIDNYVSGFNSECSTPRWKHHFFRGSKIVFSGGTQSAYTVFTTAYHMSSLLTCSLHSNPLTHKSCQFNVIAISEHRT